MTSQFSFCSPSVIRLLSLSSSLLPSGPNPQEALGKHSVPTTSPLLATVLSEVLRGLPNAPSVGGAHGQAQLHLSAQETCEEAEGHLIAGSSRFLCFPTHRRGLKFPAFTPLVHKLLGLPRS